MRSFAASRGRRPPEARVQDAFCDSLVIPSLHRLRRPLAAEGAARPGLDVPGQPVVVAEHGSAHLQDGFGALRVVPELFRPLHAMVGGRGAPGDGGSPGGPAAGVGAAGGAVAQQHERESYPGVRDAAEGERWHAERRGASLP